MGGYPTKYTGIQIDDALEKGRKLRVVNNGWIRLNSSSTTPTDLSSLKNPGNYVTSFWTNGPDLGEDSITPININVVTINGDIYQFADIIGKRYKRCMPSGTSVYGNWSIDQTSGAINPGPTSPSNPIDGETLWLDTSNADSPILKLYKNGEWKEVIPETAMQASVYDPQGKKSDIFKYIDDAIAAASLGSSGIDFDAHINDENIHVTEADKLRWNSSATRETVNDAANSLESTLEAKVTEAVSGDLSKINELTTTASSLKSDIDTHIATDEIHPTIEQQAYWDSKSDADHTHYLDGNVTVDIDHVVGEISMDVLPYTVKERTYLASSEEEVYAVEKNPTHNGDVYCVETSEGNEWYFVVDDSYLGNTSRKWIEGNISSTKRNWTSVCYGKDKFVVVARTSNYFAYSTDGITWTEGNISDTSRDWLSICYGKDKFVAVASSNYFAYSTDGITWTEGTISSTSRDWWSVCYGNGKYVAVAYDTTYFIYSTDGITWTEGTIGSTGRLWQFICYGKDKFVAVANESYFAYSTDGITWTEGTISDTSREWMSICYGKDKFVAVADSSNYFAYSYDGITWTEGTISSTIRAWNSVCYGNDKFVAVEYSANYFAYSTDGITWTEGTISNTNRVWYSVCYGNDKFVTIAYNSNYFAYSELLPESAKAFKRFSTKPQGILWSDIKNTPTTIAGYGITDAATPDSIAAIETKLTTAVENIPSDADLSAVANAQTMYTAAVSNLKTLDTAFASLDEEIAKLETMIS